MSNKPEPWELIDPEELPEDVTLFIVNALAMPGFPPPMPGAELRPCCACGRDTWAAPSSIAAERKRRTLYACRRDGQAAALLMDAGTPMGRLPDAAADVTAPGSLVTEEGERELARQMRR